LTENVADLEMLPVANAASSNLSAVSSTDLSTVALAEVEALAKAEALA
jgi:hypothetical protein